MLVQVLQPGKSFNLLLNLLMKKMSQPVNVLLMKMIVLMKMIALMKMIVLIMMIVLMKMIVTRNLH